MNVGKRILLRTKLNQINFVCNKVTNINNIFSINQFERNSKEIRQSMINTQNQSMTFTIRGNQVVLTSFDHKQKNDELEKSLSDDLLSSLNGVPVSASISNNIYSEFEVLNSEEDEQITDINLVEIENRYLFNFIFLLTLFLYRLS